MTKKEEFEEKFTKDMTYITSHSRRRLSGDFEKAWSWLENEIIQAKQNENERNVEMFLSLPEGDFRDFDIAEILRKRNSELEKEKTK